MQGTESRMSTWGWLVAGLGACAICCAGPLLAALGLSAVLAGGAAWVAGSWLVLGAGAVAVVGATAWLLRRRLAPQGCCPEGTVCAHANRVGP